MKIEIKNLYKSFGDKEVLKNICLSAESGKALGLLGRNGAGKTTTIRILMGLFEANSGEILLDGKKYDREKMHIGYLPEERGLYTKKKILQQLVYFGELKGMKGSEAKRCAHDYLEKFGMLEYENKKLQTLSKGNQQKIQLIAALIDDPDIVILDEPFTGLDPVNAKILKDEVEELISKNKIVLFSSHQMNYIEEFCNDIAILNQGAIVKSGKITDIKKSYPRNKINIGSNDIKEIEKFLLTNCNDLISEVKIVDENLFIELNDENQRNNILKQLSENNFDIDTFNVIEPSLNDIFVEHTVEGI